MLPILIVLNSLELGTLLAWVCKLTQTSHLLLLSIQLLY